MNYKKYAGFLPVPFVICCFYDRNGGIAQYYERIMGQAFDET